MLESKAQTILSAQNKTIAFDADVGESIGSKSSTNSEFSTELTRAQESIGSQQSSGNTQNANATEQDHSNKHSKSDSLNANAGSQVTNTAQEKTPGSAANAVQNNSGITQAIDEQRLKNTGQKLGPDNNAYLSSMPDTLLRDELTQASALEIDSEATANPITKSVVAKDIASELSNQEEQSTSTAPDSSTLKQRDALLKTNAVEQYVKDLADLKYTDSAKVVDQKVQQVPLAKQGKIAAASGQHSIVDSHAHGAEPVEVVEKVVVAEALQGSLNNAESSNLKAGKEEVASAPNVAGETVTSVEDTLFPSLSNAASATESHTNTNQSEARRVTAVQNGIAGIANASAGRAGDQLTANVTSPTVTAGSGVEAPQATPANAAQSLSASAMSSASTISTANMNATTGTDSTVTGHEFLRNVAGLRPDTQQRGLNIAAPIAGAKVINNETISSVGSQSLNRVASPLGTASASLQSTAADSTIVVNNTNTTAGKVDGPDAPTISTLTVGRGFSADNFSGANSDTGGAQQRFQQPAGKLEVNVDKGVVITPMPNTNQNSIKGADVTPGSQAKQILGVNQQLNLGGMHAVNATNEVPSSNVYHVTTNGIITANSTPLNAAPLSDLASAPRTVLLDQPNADQSLVENLRWAVNEKLSRVTVNVTPANLGPISVSVDVENQNMSVSIITNNVIAKDAIDSLLPRMREHFSSEGYQQVSVDVSSQQERNSNLKNQTAEFFDNQNNSESGSDAGNSQNTGLMQDAVSHEQNANISGHQPSAHSLIDTYA